MRTAVAAFSLWCACGLGLAFGQAAPIAARSAISQYEAGDFQAAALAGESEGGAEGYTLAARALIALAMRDLRGPASGRYLDRAEKNSQAALALAPEAVEPRLTLALALGMKGRRASLNEALAKDYAARGKKLIEDVLDRAPDEPRAYALLGGWNLEVVRRGGPIGARLMGASTRAGIRAFDRARALAPNNPTIALHYAVALLTLDSKRYGEKARDLLQAAANAAPADAFEAATREHARRLAALLASGGAQAAADSAARSFL
jgi:hypothetical protein